MATKEQKAKRQLANSTRAVVGLAVEGVETTFITAGLVLDKIGEVARREGLSQEEVQEITKKVFERMS